MFKNLIFNFPNLNSSRQTTQQSGAIRIFKKDQTYTAPQSNSHTNDVSEKGFCLISFPESNFGNPFIILARTASIQLPADNLNIFWAATCFLFGTAYPGLFRFDPFWVGTVDWFYMQSKLYFLRTMSNMQYINELYFDAN